MNPGQPNGAGKFACVITHLPNQELYHEHRLDVIKTSLVSMRNGAPDVPIMIWDNGSCVALTKWLQSDFRPHTLILSPNIGKSNARASLVRMVTSDTLIGIADDDMLYYPGWFDACTELITKFPEVGKASCFPVRTQGRWGSMHTKSWAKNHGKLEVGKFLTEQEERDFCDSVGRTYEHHLEITKDDVDYRVTYKGTSAYCYAHHCQFVARAGTIAPFCKRSADYMADEKPFDNSVDDAGLLQLTTVVRHARHIGNIVDENVVHDLITMGLITGKAA
jgi:hypothetical protein